MRLALPVEGKGFVEHIVEGMNMGNEICRRNFLRLGLGCAAALGGLRFASAGEARAPKLVAATEREADVQTMLARIPAVAFETLLADLGLTTRVQGHLEKAELSNVGQVMQRLAEGDEAMLL